MLGGIVALDRPDLADEVDRWLEAHPVPQGELALRQHRERMRVNVAHRERSVPVLETGLLRPTGTG
jgi:hypothetical protein